MPRIGSFTHVASHAMAYIYVMVKKRIRHPFPEKISPMLATSVKDAFTDPQWLFEIKWDGYRVTAYVQGGKATLYSRGGQDYTQKCKAIADELCGLPDCVLDGEVVVFNEQGKPDFGLLQNYQGEGDIAYYIFDLLYYDGEQYTKRPLLQRKEMLLHVIKRQVLVHYSDHFDNGLALFEKMQELGLEGIIAKRKDSFYQPGQRSKDWLKIKTGTSRQYIIGGWSESKTTSSFRSILFGELVDGKLRYVHHSGGGYTSKEKSDLFKMFKQLEIAKCPFVNPKDVIMDTKCHWIKPDLSAEFELSGKTTKTGIIRHPAIFKGLRQARPALDVEPETVKAAQGESPGGGSWESVLSRKITSQEKISIEGRSLTLVNIERHIWHDVSKADLIRYYISMAEYLLPHLKDRPLGINVSLYGPENDFFLRGMEGHAPRWAGLYQSDRKHRKAGKSDKIEWLVCNNLATLIWIVNLECIDIHPWASRTTSPNNPDYIGIDLDPTDNDFKKVIATATAAKELFDKMKLKAFVKTSGKTGMHLYLPCSGIEYVAARTIAENICSTIHELVPSITTTSTSVNSRGNKLYVDPSQNDYGDRLAAAYCVRAYKIPAVSTPLDWKEVKPGLDPAAFDMHNLLARVEKKGDLFAGVHEEKVAMRNGRTLQKFL